MWLLFWSLKFSKWEKTKHKGKSAVFATWSKVWGDLSRPGIQLLTLSVVYNDLLWVAGVLAWCWWSPLGEMLQAPFIGEHSEARGHAPRSPEGQVVEPGSTFRILTPVPSPEPQLLENPLTPSTTATNPTCCFALLNHQQLFRNTGGSGLFVFGKTPGSYLQVACRWRACNGLNLFLEKTEGNL